MEDSSKLDSGVIFLMTQMYLDGFYEWYWNEITQKRGITNWVFPSGPLTSADLVRWLQQKDGDLAKAKMS